MERDNTYFFEEAPIPNAVAHMGIPMILGMFFGVFYNLVDTFFIGQLGDANLVAASMLALPMFTIYMGIGNIFGVGCGTYISRLLGEKDYETVKYTSSFSFYACLLSGLLFTIFALLYIEPILKLLGTSIYTIDAARSFITVIIYGGSFIMLSFSMGQIVRAEGSSRESMVGMFIGTIGNIVLDPIMIFTFHLGVTGAAYATVIANGLAVLYYGWYFIKKSQMLTISMNYFTLKYSIIRNSLAIGMPVFITTLLLMLSSVLLNNLAAQYADAVVAILGIAIQINMICEFLVSGLCEGVQPLIGYNYAANNKERMNNIIKFTGLCGMLISTFIAVTLYLSSDSVIRLFISDEEIIRLGAPLFQISMLAQITYGIIFLFTTVFQATGKSVPTLLMSISQGVLFLPALYWGNTLLGLNGVAYALPISEFGTAILAVILFWTVKDDFADGKKSEGNLIKANGKLKYWVISLLLMIMLLMIGKLVINFREETKAAPMAGSNVITVTSASAAIKSKVPMIFLTGSIEGETSAIISAKISGRIAEIFVEDGQKVSAGQALLRLESTELANSVHTSQGEVRKTQANYNNILTNFNRYQTLFSQNAISSQQLDSARTSLETAEAELSNAYAALDTANKQYADAVVTAPVDGMVANKTAVIGQVVASGAQLMTVEKTSQVYAIINIEQKNMGLIHQGLQAQVTVDAYPGKMFNGTIDIINPTAGNSTRMFRIKIKIDNPEGMLKPGMFVKTGIVTGDELPALLVPQNAVFQKQGIYYLYVIEDEKVTRKKVEIGQVTDDQIEIKAGISEGALVAISNVNTLKDGDAVIVAQ